MKKLFLFFLLGVFVVSCKKENTDPAPENNTTPSTSYSMHFYLIDGESIPTYTNVYVKIDGNNIGAPEIKTATTIVNGQYYDFPSNIPPSSLNFSVNDGQTYHIEFYDAANDQLIGEINNLPINATEVDGYFFNTDPAFQLTTYGNTLLPNSNEEIFRIDGSENQLFYFLELQL